MGEHGLLVNVIIFLAAAVIFVPLASRFKLGSVLGYLVAGCVIGPWGSGLVTDAGSTLHLAEFGVVLMLFLIGLELDLGRLWSMRRQVFGAGSLQLGVCGVALTAGGLVAGLPWQGALVAGLALALSSTAIAIATMEERNLRGGPMGKTAFAILLFQDIAAIPVIALVPLLGTKVVAAAEAAAASGGDPMWLSVGRVLGAIVGVVLVGRYLTRPMLRMVAGTGLREVFTAFTLLLVVGIAWMMQLAGVSMALGAFLAGVLLASSEYRHALQTDVEPFKGLLMGLFFIAIGISIDFGLLAERPLQIAALVVGFTVIKAGALAALGGRIGVDRCQRWLFAALLAQGGEFAFVVFTAAGQVGVLPAPWQGLLTLVVALSMGLTPLLLLLHDKLTAADARDDAREFDKIEPEDAEVIIAGFGRFGQIVGRFLMANGVRITVLDQDPSTIESLRKFGFRVFYGDATRLDLLEAAGAGDAKLLVNAIDDVEDSMDLVDKVREHFPRLAILARARNVTHYYELRKHGVEVVERETFESALRLGRKVLEGLGQSPYEVRELSERFRRHNIATLEALLPHIEDEARRVSMARAAREQLERQFERDRAALGHPGRVGWHRDVARHDAITEAHADGSDDAPSDGAAGN